MPTYRFKGFASGAPVAVSASTGGASGSAGIVAWGVPTGGAGATGRVSLIRPGTNPTLAVGEQIRFDVTSISGLDVSSGPYVAYDPYDHEVEWEWTITPPAGEPTTWSACTNLYGTHQNRMKRAGRYGAIIPQTAGSWRFDVKGVDKNGTVLELWDTCDVVETSAVVPDADCWLVHDGDLTGAGTADVDYDSGRVYASWDAFVTALNNFFFTAVPVRVKVKGGATFTQTLTLGGFRDTLHLWPHLIFETYGSGDATINCAGNSNFYEDNFAPFMNVQFNGINILGPWNAATQLFYDAGFGIARKAFSIGTNSGSERALSVSNGRIEGWGQTISQSTKVLSCYENCTVRSYLDYGSISNGDAYLIGCDMTTFPGTMAGGIRTEAPARLGGYRNSHGPWRGSFEQMHTCQLSVQSAWNWGSFTDWPAMQAALRITREVPIDRMSISRCVIEGFVQFVGDTGTNTQTSINAVMDQNIVLSFHQQGRIDVELAGVTVRNNMLLGSTAVATTGFSPLPNSKIKLGTTAGTKVGNTDPVRILSNTGVEIRTGDHTFDMVEVVNAFSDQTIANNLPYGPNFDTPQEPDGALVAETGIVPTNTGAVMGFTHWLINIPSDVANGASTPEFTWAALGSDTDGNPVDNTTFSGGEGEHLLYLNGATLSYQPNYVTAIDGLEFNLTATGVTIANNTDTGLTIGGILVSGVLKAGNYRLQLDRRHDPVVKTGTASGANDGQLWAPASAITPDNAALVPHWDFKGNVRSGSPTKGAIDPNGVAA